MTDTATEEKTFEDLDMTPIAAVIEKHKLLFVNKDGLQAWVDWHAVPNTFRYNEVIGEEFRVGVQARALFAILCPYADTLDVLRIGHLDQRTWNRSSYINFNTHYAMLSKELKIYTYDLLRAIDLVWPGEEVWRHHPQVIDTYPQDIAFYKKLLGDETMADLYEQIYTDLDSRNLLSVIVSEFRIPISLKRRALADTFEQLMAASAQDRDACEAEFARLLRDFAHHSCIGTRTDTLDLLCEYVEMFLGLEPKCERQTLVVNSNDCILYQLKYHNEDLEMRFAKWFFGDAERDKYCPLGDTISELEIERYQGISPEAKHFFEYWGAINAENHAVWAAQRASREAENKHRSKVVDNLKKPEFQRQAAETKKKGH